MAHVALLRKRPTRFKAAAMAAAAHPRRRPRAKVAPVLIGLLALWIQALVPAAALAASGGRPERTMVICTAMGAQTITLTSDEGETRQGFAGLPCQDCLGLTIAATTPPLLTLARAHFPAELAPETTTTEPGLRRARAPPRPHSQGPPPPNA
jgi:hypothetical protein